MEAVYRAYLPLVRTIVTHGFGGFGGFSNPSDHDDSVQSIFAAAFEERARLSYNGVDAYSSFLRGIAHNVVRQMLDKRRRYLRSTEEGQAPVPEPPESLEDATIARQEEAILRAFFESVTEPREAQVLELYFREGWPEEKLAAHLNLTRYRLRKTIAKLHKRMMRYLEDHGIRGA